MKTILVVEDEAEAQKLIYRFLTDEGYNVLGAASLEQANKVIASLKSLDAAVVDFWLDGSSSQALMEALSSQFPNLPIIMISGGRQAFPIEVSHAVSHLSGASQFIQKPFERQELVSVLRAALS